LRIELHPGGAVKFVVDDREHAVTPAMAKRVLEDALEALTKWSLEH
jgi:hypothetical protein